MRKQMMMTLAVAVTLALGGCAAKSQPAKQAAASAPAAAAPKAAAAAPKAAATSGNALSKVTVGMTKAQVREAVGGPSDENSYMSGKAWIPFYFGNDARRSTWFYKGQGRVVFADGNVFGGGGANVLRVEIDPAESGVAR